MNYYTKTILQILLAVFITVEVTAQDWVWSHHFNTSQASLLTGLAADSDMNLFVTGQFKSDIDLGGGSDLAKLGSVDMFLAKYDSSGAYSMNLHAYSTGGKVRPKNVVIDHNNDIIVTGFYTGAVEGDLALDKPANGKFNAFVAKYNGTTYALEWADTINGPSDIKAQYVSVDPIGNIYITGVSDSTITVGDSTFYSSNNHEHCYIAKFSSGGDFQWASQVQTSGDDCKFIEISSPVADKIYVAGYFTDTLYAEDIKIWSSYNDNNGVILKYDGSGQPLWARMMGGAGFDRCNGIDTDSDGNVYATGYITGEAVFDSLGNGSQESSKLISEGGFDIFVAKYTDSGRLKWKQRHGGAGDDIGFGAYVFENLIQFAGYFSDTFQFNNSAMETEGLGDQDAAFFVVDTEGNAISGHSVQGSAFDYSELLTYDNAGNTYMGLVFKSPSLQIGDSIYANGNPTTPQNNGTFGKYQFEFTAFWKNHTNVSCNGGNDGTLEVSSYFGTGPYTYEWSSPDTSVIEFDDSLAYNLMPGDYMVTVTDVNTKEATTSLFTISEPSPIVLEIDSTNLSCYQSNDGTITLTNISGGTSPYAYAWSGPSGSNPTEPNQTNLTAGTYTLLVTDKNLCTKTTEVTLTEPEALFFGEVVVEMETPDGSMNGSIDLDVTGGTLDYTYAWVKDDVDSLIGRVNDTLLNIAEGIYKAYVTDANACQADTLITVPGATLRVSMIGSNELCFGDNSGSAYATVTSGRKGFDFTFAFEDSEGTTIIATNDTIIDNLQPGKYYVTVTEDGGEARSIMDSVIIEAASEIVLSSTTDSVSCYGGANGVVNLTVLGGESPYTYLWTNDAETKNIVNVEAGVYTVTVTDNNNCSVELGNVVSQPDSMAITFIVVDAIQCFGDVGGAIRADVLGGNAPYRLEWNDSRFQTGHTASDLVSGIYEVMVTDAKNCTNTDSYELEEPELLVMESIDSMHVSCVNAADGRIMVTMAGGTEPYQYNWSGDLPDTNIVEDLSAASYTLSVNDAHGCIVESVEVVIEQPEVALALVEDGDKHLDNLCNGDTDGSVTVIASGGWEGAYEYSLDKDAWKAEADFTSIAAGAYMVYVQDANACIDSVASTITEPTQITITSEEVNDDVITVVATGGTGALSYLLNGEGTPQATGVFEDLENGNYYVEVDDENLCGPVRSGDLVVTTIGVGYSIEDASSIYPNPSNGLFNLTFIAPESGAYDIELFSLNGVRVYSDNFYAIAGETKVLEIDLLDASSGVYLIQLNGMVLNTKLVLE